MCSLSTKISAKIRIFNDLPNNFRVNWKINQNNHTFRYFWIRINAYARKNTSNC